MLWLRTFKWKDRARTGNLGGIERDSRKEQAFESLQGYAILFLGFPCRCLWRDGLSCLLLQSHAQAGSIVLFHNYLFGGLVRSWYCQTFDCSFVEPPPNEVRFLLWLHLGVLLVDDGCSYLDIDPPVCPDSAGGCWPFDRRAPDNESGVWLLQRDLSSRSAWILRRHDDGCPNHLDPTQIQPGVLRWNERIRIWTCARANEWDLCCQKLNDRLKK